MSGWIALLICLSSLVPKATSAGLHTCDFGNRQLTEFYVCNGEFDCDDESDELDCPNYLQFDVVYLGSLIEDDFFGTGWRDVYSWEECSSECSMVDNCTHWSVIPSSSDQWTGSGCWLMKDLGDNLALIKAAVSGTSYCAMDQEHTMCKYKGPFNRCDSRVRGLDSASKDAILYRHNELRSKVANGLEQSQPAAANMKKLVWNNELENIAQRRADQCNEFDAHNVSRVKLDGTSVGQNIAMAYSSNNVAKSKVRMGAAGQPKGWYSEVSPEFDSGLVGAFQLDSGYDHYTQVVWASTEEVGCGLVYFKERDWYNTLVVCNYAVAGNMVGRTMYTEGKACTSCPSGYDDCEDGLCSM